MIRVLALVEGPTERNFGQQVLAPHLGNHGVAFSPKVVGKPGHKGGARWEVAKRDIVALLKQAPGFCTTMFDFYGMPPDWPGRKEARQSGLTKLAAALKIEQSIESEVAAAMNANPGEIPFLAYLSLHEYEALLFTDPQMLASVTMQSGDAQKFAAVVADCGGCENINDDPNTAPSRRLLQIAPSYKKASDGPVAAKRIGLQTMRSQCPHFNAWLTRLESLGQR